MNATTTILIFMSHPEKDKSRSTETVARGFSPAFAGLKACATYGLRPRVSLRALRSTSHFFERLR
jgi:hypothetical protein